MRSWLLAVGLVGCVEPRPSLPAEPPKAAPIAEPAASTSVVPVAGSPRFALIELFTSEGCSSCPPAEAVLSSVSRRPGVLVLAWHVDYWDYLGWKDRFSRAAFSDRQRVVASFLGKKGLYTPQLVVDGRVEMIGSHEAEANSAIANALELSRTVTVAASVEREEKGTVFVRVEVAGAALSSHVRIALVEDGLVVRPNKGENAGELLHHDGVVRAFSSQTFAGAPLTFGLGLPPDGKRSNLRIVAWVEAPGGVSVVGATRVQLP